MLREDTQEGEERESHTKRTLEERLRIEHQAKGGADWFFWVAGLSIVNSLILLSGRNWSFIIGLGMTQFIDAIALMVAEEIGHIGKIIGAILDAFAAGIFVVFGIFARKRYQWSFIVGMILYALDGLLFLLVQDMLSLGFHIFVLYGVYRGLAATRMLNMIETQHEHQAAS